MPPATLQVIISLRWSIKLDERPKIKLNNRFEIPAIGLGTYQAQPDAAPVSEAVAYAIKEVGYRQLDCALVYRNEKLVGEGIRLSGVPRSEIFIISKLWGTYHTRVEEGLNETLADLGTDYLDLYLIHWPFAFNPKGAKLPDGRWDVDHNVDLRDTWKQMEALVKKGKVKSIGISNFSQVKVEYLLGTAEIVPAVNQLELHVHNPQHKLLAFLKSKGIVAQAYSPLGSTNAPLLTDETVTEIAAEHSLQPADILLGYLLAKDIVILPKSVSNNRIASNFKGALAAAEKLDQSELERLDGLAASGKQKRFITPNWPVDLGFDD